MDQGSPVGAARPLAAPLGFAAGVLLGAAAGLIGVGGGEFRIPVLLYLFRRDVKTTAAVNLVVGFLTVTLSFVRRFGQMSWQPSALSTAAILAAASLVGAVVGVLSAHRLPSRALLRVVVVYLLLVGTWMIVESVTHTESHILEPVGSLRVALLVGVGFAVAVLSAALGVAGGELRIPTLIYLFAYDAKAAGTLSLFASIPTVLAGAFGYRRAGHLPGAALKVAAIMGAGSVIGVLVGTSVLPHVHENLLRGLLGAILLLATVALAGPAFRRERRPA